VLTVVQGRESRCSEHPRCAVTRVIRQGSASSIEAVSEAVVHCSRGEFN
jgi:hypothetical protein